MLQKFYTKKFHHTIFLFLILFFALNVNSQTNRKYLKWYGGKYKGFNILFETSHTYKDFTDFKNYGGNLFEIGVFGWNKEDPPYSIQQNNIDSTDKFVNYCRQAGIYYVLAVRSGPGAYDTYKESHGLTSESRIWNTGNTSEQQLYASMLKNMVSRYSSDTLFAGIDLVVEPRPKVTLIPANTSSMYKFFLENVYHIHMDAVYAGFVSSIRSVDTKIPILIENFAYSTPELFPGYIINDPYIVYTTHNYMPKEYTNASQNYSSAYPGTFWNITYLAQKYYDANFLKNTIFKNVRDFQNSTNAPIFIGEMGIMYPQHGASKYLNDIFGLSGKYGWNWAIWDWRRGSGQEWDIELFGEDSSSPGIKPFDIVLSYFRTSSNTNTFIENFNNTDKIILSENYPNPFNPSTNIKYQIPKSGYVSLVIYDVLGREIQRLVNEYKQAGYYEVKFDGSNFTSGMYFYRIESGNFVNVKRMMLVK